MISVSDRLGRPIAGASVSATGPSSQSGTTSATGTVTLSSVAAASYTVTATAMGFEHGSGTVTAVAATTQALSLSLVSGVELIVVLTSARDGSPVANATVDISGPSPASRRSDARGHASFTGIEPGAYEIATTHSLFDPGTGSATARAQQTSNVNLALTPRGPVSPIITLPASPVVLVKKPHTAPARREVRLTISDSFDGNGVFTRSSAHIRFFTALTGGTELRFNGTENRFTGAQLRSGGGVRVFAEGASASAALDDVHLTLTLSGGTQPFAGPVVATMTAVEFVLEICKSRTAAQVTAAAAPTAMSAADKIAVGRFLHTQDVGSNAGRALLIVHKAVPHAFAGNLVLNAFNARVRIFAAETGGAALPADHPVANATIPAAGQQFWLEGAAGAAANSAVLRDTGARLGVQGVDPDGDNVRATVVTFTRIQATIHATPPHTPRAGQPAPLDHIFQSTSLSEDFAINRPLVLMRNAQPDIALVVTASLPGLPVVWQALRNPADHASLGGAAAVPALRAGGTVLDRVLNANARGSFRIRAYLDTNGTGTYQDREPSIALNLVLGDVQSLADVSHADSTQLVEAVAGIRTGIFTAGAAAMEMDLSCDVTGGGADGKLGLDRIFAGLVNNLAADTIHADYQLPPAPPAVQPIHPLANVYVTNPGVATGAFGARRMFLPGDPAPVQLAFPHLDSGRANAGTGGNLACMGSSNVVKGGVTASGIGERWQITCVDSPARGFPAVHPGFPGTRLVAITWHQDFVASFCFWTNVTANIGATGDPADRVYSVVRIVPWTIRGRWTIAHPAVGPAVLTRVSYAVATQPRRRLIPIARAQDNGVEVRPPSGIGPPFAWDART
ncbi:MAG: carboxypeptidase regulatory-like domain-containing protein [Myxococcales bacterium]|nr:carboxypeptidase regulatory-like domain-containing protein [Myxococcales bacterium]